jgi:hypothetical protein
MTVAMAALSWKLLEQPLNGLKHLFPYQPEGVQALQPMLSGSQRRVPS